MAAGVALLEQCQGKTGVYFVSQEMPEDPDQHFPVKVGMAHHVRLTGASMRGRLESYLTYWVRGFHVYGLLFRRTKRAALSLERSLHRYLKGKGRAVVVDYEQTHAEEWFYLSRRELDTIVDNLVVAGDVNRHVHVLTNVAQPGRWRVRVRAMATPERRTVDTAIEAEDVLRTIKRKKSKRPRAFQTPVRQSPRAVERATPGAKRALFNGKD